MPFCNNCGSDVPAGVKFCPGCGTPAGGGAPGAGAAPHAAPAASAAENQNIFAAVGYVVPIVAIVLLFIDPYNRNRFIRFHSFQSIFFVLGMMAVYFMLAVLGFVVGIIPGIGMLAFLFIPIYALLGLGWFVVLVLLAVRAYQGQEWRLPVVGDFAAKYV